MCRRRERLSLTVIFLLEAGPVAYSVARSELTRGPARANENV